jgi:hypothetical protein
MLGRGRRIRGRAVDWAGVAHTDRRWLRVAFRDHDHQTGQNRYRHDEATNEARRPETGPPPFLFGSVSRNAHVAFLPQMHHDADADEDDREPERRHRRVERDQANQEREANNPTVDHRIVAACATDGATFACPVPIRYPAIPIIPAHTRSTMRSR